MDETVSPTYQPLYQQIKALLVARLANNEWPPGAALPSEIALAQAYNVSQGTVRKALAAMEEERLVERWQGRGTFAARHSRQRSLFQFFHLLGENHERQLPDSRLISCRCGRATRAESAALEIERGARVTRIQRVRELNGRLVINEALSVPTALFPGLERRRPEQIPNTLYEFYASEYGVMIVHASERLRAVAATNADAQNLGVAVGTPLLAVERLALNIEHRPVEWRLSYCDTTHHYYFNELD
jgi:GntR family transcriptional regulator